MGLAMTLLKLWNRDVAYFADETAVLQGATKLSPSNSFLAPAKVKSKTQLAVRATRLAQFSDVPGQGFR